MPVYEDTDARVQATGGGAAIYFVMIVVIGSLFLFECTRCIIDVDPQHIFFSSLLLSSLELSDTKVYEP